MLGQVCLHCGISFGMLLLFNPRVLLKFKRNCFSLDSAFLWSSSARLLRCSASSDDQGSAELHQKIWTSCWNARGHECIVTAPQTGTARPPAAAAAQVSPDTEAFFLAVFNFDTTSKSLPVNYTVMFTVYIYCSTIGRAGFRMSGPLWVSLRWILFL